MRDVQTLIKMQKLYVDEQRKVLAEKQRQADALHAALRDLEDNLEAEKKGEGAHKEGSFLIGAFIRRELSRKEDLASALTQTRREIEVSREKLALLFEELKRFEIVQENWDEQAAAERLRNENAAYDEQAGTRHERNKEG
ncbi:MAG TPA: hypothetical protein VHB73_05255 [Alphaproteobacteria bacterium]|nr:hypothetical protein [Alphaproteobacteria bacterium]